ncbi:MAG: hypothetical protein OXN89_21850 [Bryobacterales bacterium]|nr:hypothetical protein [Bryobacterales bacterium]
MEWYRLRWRIEDWHRVLKTGLKVEQLQHNAGERIKRAETVAAVIAWPLMLMLGWQTPEQPAEVLFTETELLVLRDFAYKRKLTEPSALSIRKPARIEENQIVSCTHFGMRGAHNGEGDRTPEPKGRRPAGAPMDVGHSDLSSAARAHRRILRLKQENLLIRKLRPHG